jgi:FtsZ-binding cell division protein ZapB
LQAELDATKQQLANSNKENSDLKDYIDKLKKANEDVKNTAVKSQQIVNQHQ